MGRNSCCTLTSMNGFLRWKLGKRESYCPTSSWRGKCSNHRSTLSPKTESGKSWSSADLTLGFLQLGCSWMAQLISLRTVMFELEVTFRLKQFCAKKKTALAVASVRQSKSVAVSANVLGFSNTSLQSLTIAHCLSFKLAISKFSTVTKSKCSITKSRMPMLMGTMSSRTRCFRIKTGIFTHSLD